jgi:hypothetical protein
MTAYFSDLHPRFTPGALVSQTGFAAWHLEVPAGPGGRYRLAQLDDYHDLPRGKFAWQPPAIFRWRARASARDLPGTWGFGLWNDPFGFALLKGGGVRLPVLPNAAWFFFASPPNYLSLRDDLPAQGGLAATFSSPRRLSLVSAVGAPLLPLLLLPPAARLFRRWCRRIIRQDAASLAFDPSDWHTYALAWDDQQTTFQVDGELVLQTSVSPAGPLGLVLWVDNQYAALPPDGRIRYGTLPNPESAWIEIEALSLIEQEGIH